MFVGWEELRLATKDIDFNRQKMEKQVTRYDKCLNFGGEYVK
jgi:hypothetical protein